MVELINVVKIYKDGGIKTCALRGVSLKVEQGEFIAIVGPSGSGKTTLLNLIGCLDTPTEGKIFLDGEDITHLSTKALTEIRRKKIGFIFQTFNLISVLNVYENIELVLFMTDLPSKVRKEKVLHMLNLLGLENVANHKAVNISGGQQQRVAIARALIKEPIVVLADEPTGNLDSDTTFEIINLMRELNEKKGVTFIFATHDERIIKYAKKVYKLKDGIIENKIII